MLTGDAHAGVLTDGLRRLAAERNADRVSIDAFKVSHHGSKYNLSNEALGLVDCGRFLFSSNGRSYRHPDATAVSRIVVGETERSLEFNYRTEFTESWESSRRRPTLLVFNDVPRRRGQWPRGKAVSAPTAPLHSENTLLDLAGPSA